jgi:hypothetical protein
VQLSVDLVDWLHINPALSPCRVLAGKSTKSFLAVSSFQSAAAESFRRLAGTCLSSFILIIVGCGRS